MKDIVIEVRGGAISNVYSDLSDARVIVVDWDLVTNGGGGVRAGYIQAQSKLRHLPSDTKKEYEAAVP